MLLPDQFQRPTLRVTLITPDLSPSSRWVVTLAQHLKVIRPAAVISLEGSGELSSEIPREVPILSLKKGLAVPTDVILGTGTPPKLPSDVPVVWCSHSSAKIHDESLYDGVHFLAAVTISAAEAYPVGMRTRMRTQLIHSGVDSERTRPRFGRKRQRDLWQIPEAAKIVLFLGQFSPEENPAALIQVMHNLTNDYFGVLVGYGPDSRQLMDLPAPPSVGTDAPPSRIAFVKPTLSHVGDVLAASDVLLLPSDPGGFPHAIAEAWQTGLPVVSGEFPSAREISEKFPDTSLYFAKSDNLASVIQSATEPSPENEERNSKSLALGMTYFSASAMCDRWESYLIHAINTFRDVSVFGEIQYSAPYQSVAPPYGARQGQPNSPPRDPLEHGRATPLLDPATAARMAKPRIPKGRK